MNQAFDEDYISNNDTYLVSSFSKSRTIDLNDFKYSEHGQGPKIDYYIYIT